MIKLICGRSRAGKTTYSKQFKNVIHLDSFGVIPGSYPRVIKKIVEMDGDVIVEGVYDTATLRAELLRSYKGGGKKVCIWLNTPAEVIENRFGRWKPKSHPCCFEPPTHAEGWDEIEVIYG